VGEKQVNHAYLGLDLGGTGVKAGVFDDTGRLLGFGKKSIDPLPNSEGRVEVPIEDVYAAARESVAKAVADSGAQIRALSISSQGETFVSLDEHDQPLHPAIIWYDSRAGEQAAKLRDIPELAGQGLYLESVASAPKILWLREHHPELMSRAKRFLLLPDYFTLRLTGDAVTDPSTAQSTGLYVDGSASYSLEALAAAEISEDSLARILPSASPVARLTPRAAEEWGLSPETLVVTGTNDQYAGALGAGNCRPGIVSETTGTCLALVSLTECLPDPMPPGLFGGRFPIPRYSFALAYAKTAGLVLDWFNREVCPSLTLAELDNLALETPPGSNGLIVLPHFDGMISPYPNPNSRGCIANLTLAHTAGHIYRAILESLSFSLRENIELLKNNGFALTLIRSIGGGAKSDLWLQMKADVCGLPVECPAVAEAATLGAAMLASVGVGDYKNVEDCSAILYKMDKLFTPDASKAGIYGDAYRTYVELHHRMYG
jgi:xylulokinase